MPFRTLALIWIAVIVAAAGSVWLISQFTGGQFLSIGIPVAVVAALVLRLALRRRTP